MLELYVLSFKISEPHSPLFSSDLKKSPLQYLSVLILMNNARFFSVLLSLSLKLFLLTYGAFKKLLEQRLEKR